jgi:hypothetical protein
MLKGQVIKCQVIKCQVFKWESRTRFLVKFPHGQRKAETGFLRLHGFTVRSAVT